LVVPWFMSLSVVSRWHTDKDTHFGPPIQIITDGLLDRQREIIKFPVVLLRGKKRAEKLC
jgi:hypothetical protein